MNYLTRLLPRKKLLRMTIHVYSVRMISKRDSGGFDMLLKEVYVIT